MIKIEVNYPQIYAKLSEDSKNIEQSSGMALPDNMTPEDFGWTLYNSSDEAYNALSPLIPTEYLYNGEQINEIESQVYVLRENQFTITGGNEYEE